MTNSVIIKSTREAGLAKRRFHGVKLSELNELENLYKVNIQVYSLTPTQAQTAKMRTMKKIHLTLLQHFSTVCIIATPALST